MEFSTKGAMATPFKKFWASMQSVKNATGVVALLITRFLGNEVGELNFHDLSVSLNRITSGDQDMRLSITEIARMPQVGDLRTLVGDLITIFYISIYFEIDPGDRLLSTANLHWTQTRNIQARNAEEDIITFVPEVSVTL